MYSSRHESFGSKAGSSCFSECASGLGNPTGASTTEVVLRTYEANSGGTMVSPISHQLKRLDEGVGRHDFEEIGVGSGLESSQNPRKNILIRDPREPRRGQRVVDP